MPIKPENQHRYPADWKDIRRKILERAGKRCEFCGAENHKSNPVTGSRVVLTIAHLDQQPENNNPDNLRALCQKCHLGYDRMRRRWRKEDGELR